MQNSMLEHVARTQRFATKSSLSMRSLACYCTSFPLWQRGDQKAHIEALTPNPPGFFLLKLKRRRHLGQPTLAQMDYTTPSLSLQPSTPVASSRTLRAHQERDRLETTINDRYNKNKLSISSSISLKIKHQHIG